MRHSRRSLVCSLSPQFNLRDDMLSRLVPAFTTRSIDLATDLASADAFSECHIVHTWHIGRPRQARLLDWEVISCASLLFRPFPTTEREPCSAVLIFDCSDAANPHVPVDFRDSTRSRPGTHRSRLIHSTRLNPPFTRAGIEACYSAPLWLV